MSVTDRAGAFFRATCSVAVQGESGNQEKAKCYKGQQVLGLCGVYVGERSKTGPWGQLRVVGEGEERKVLKPE